MVESEIKIYISSLSGNKEVKKRQQRVTMILDSKHIEYTVIDITEPTMEKEKDFMQANSTEMGVTVSDTNPRHPLPPQIFNGEQYCGDYNSFELANENDELEAFLKLEPAKNGVASSQPVAVNGKAEEPETPAVVAEEEKPAEPTNGVTTEETITTTETTTEETNEAKVVEDSAETTAEDNGAATAADDAATADAE
ncbi:SH3 domain-binding glutamic acid-rich protein homolog [Culicoides brevitarsis]|uniref:SH3 domain-binding glutamic acid-rich protein homolog n=1 Tax=Culicoides brevitarsis TaxID=469753 RepID=UPI00307CBCE6